MPGHYARECPKGKGGKGKGKGGGKGFAKGKGKGKVGGKGKGKPLWNSAPIKGGGKAKGKGPTYGACWSCGGRATRGIAHGAKEEVPERKGQ